MKDLSQSVMFQKLFLLASFCVRCAPVNLGELSRKKTFKPPKIREDELYVATRVSESFLLV